MAWLLSQKWFWMLSLLLMFAIIVPFIAIGLLVNFSPGTIVVLLMILVVVWVITKSYRDWNRKQEETQGAKQAEK